MSILLGDSELSTGRPPYPHVIRSKTFLCYAKTRLIPNVIYEGKSISKLQIVIEKKRMWIMTYKQHLFFNLISKQIYTLVPPFHNSLETCGVKFL